MPSRIEEIENQIELMRGYFVSISVYLRKIELKKIDNNDVIEFVSDVLGADVSASTPEHMGELIAKLKETVQIHLEDFQSFNKCLAMIDRERGLSILAILLDYKTVYAKHAVGVNKRKTFYLEDKATAAFYQTDFTQSLRKSLNECLTPRFNLLSKIVTVSSNKVLDTNRNGYTFNAQVAFNSRRLATRFSDTLNEAEKISKVDPDKEVCFPFDVSMLDSLIPDSQNGINVSGRHNTSASYSELVSALTKYVNKFYDVQSVIEKIEAFYGSRKKIINEANERKELSRSLEKYIKTCSEVKAELEDNFDKLFERADKLDNKIDETEMSVLDRQLDNLALEIRSLGTSIPTRVTDDFIREELISLKLEFDAIVVGIKQGLLLSQHTIKTHEDQVNQQKEQQISAKRQALAEEQSLRLAAQIKEREQAKAECERKIYARKAAVEAERQKKKTESERKLAETVAPKVTQFQASLFPTVEKVENEDVIERLKNLNHTYLDLILDILNEKAGIDYSKVCCLITNQLKGEIEEVGNGSSHKRIRLKAACTVIYTTCDGRGSKEEEEGQKHSVVTGGFYKPHKKGGKGAKTDKRLSKFNVSLIKSAFESAGINLEMIRSLRPSLQ